MNSKLLSSHIYRACMLEVQAPKAGNVYPSADFHDMGVMDFERSAQAIATEFESIESKTLGELILSSIQATHKVTDVNTNLGIVLLFAPIAKAWLHFQKTSTNTSPDDNEWVKSFQDVIDASTPQDAQSIYQAIVTAKPGGLGKVEESDVQDSAPSHIALAMQLASDRDHIAAEWTQQFIRTRRISKELARLRERDFSWEEAICWCQLQLLASQGDTLIRRKNGEEIDLKVRMMAQRILAYCTVENVLEHPLRSAFDHYLRDEAHQRNPGTTADLIAGGILICLLRGIQ